MQDKSNDRLQEIEGRDELTLLKEVAARPAVNGVHPLFYDPRTLTGMYEKKKNEFREGVDSPILPTLCLDKNGLWSLCLANLTYPTHYVTMGRMDMDAHRSVENDNVLSPDGEAAKFIKTFGITLSGKIRRRFRWGAHKLFFNQKIVLPVKDARAGRIEVNVRMNVDGVERVHACPIIQTLCVRERTFSDF